MHWKWWWQLWNITKFEPVVSYKCYTDQREHCVTIKDGRDVPEFVFSSPSFKAGPVTAAWWGPWQDEFWIYSRIDIALLLWAIFSIIWLLLQWRIVLNELKFALVFVHCLQPCLCVSLRWISTDFQYLKRVTRRPLPLNTKLKDLFTWRASSETFKIRKCFVLFCFFPS